MATTARERLTEAEAALHDLLSGQSVSRIVDQNNEQVSYFKTDLPSLLSYIADLRRQVSTTATGGPLQIWF